MERGRRVAGRRGEWGKKGLRSEFFMMYDKCILLKNEKNRAANSLLVFLRYGGKRHALEVYTQSPGSPQVSHVSSLASPASVSLSAYEVAVGVKCG